MSGSFPLSPIFNIVSTGSLRPRSIEDRETDVINVLDYLTAGQPDGTTDNTTQLQAAVTAGAGNTVYIPKTASNYIFTGLVLPSNIRLIVDGYLLVKSTVSSATAYMISTATGASNIIIEGFGTFDGNKANLTTPGCGAIRPNQATNVVIRDLTVKNTYRSGVYPSGCTNALMDNLTISGTGNSNGFSGAGQNGAAAVISTNCWIRNCHIDAIVDFGVGFYDGATNCGISNCVVTNTAAGNPGIFVMTDGGTLFGSNILIDGNVIQGIVGSPGPAISLSVANVAGVNSNITISNNQISIARGNGIDITNVTDISVTNNMLVSGGNVGIQLSTGTTRFKVSGNTIDACQGTGISVANSSHGSIVHNHISNVASGTPTAILLASTNVNTLVAFNNMFDTQGTPTMLNGIRSTSTPGTGAVIIGNKFTNIATPYSFTNAADTFTGKYGGEAGSLTFIPPAYAYVYLNVAQAVTGTTITKILFDTVSVDTLGAYDVATNHRYTPLRAGNYLVTMNIFTQTGTGSTTVMTNAYIYKNGAAFAHLGLEPYNTNQENETVSCTAIVAMNGTTDYLEGFGMVSGTGSPQFLGASSGITTSMLFQWLGP